GSNPAGFATVKPAWKMVGPLRAGLPLQPQCNPHDQIRQRVAKGKVFATVFSTLQFQWVGCRKTLSQNPLHTLPIIRDVFPLL
ncbi:MAG: hypothetical protein AAF890_04150, partial [Pseudomonadota bacterium]